MNNYKLNQKTVILGIGNPIRGDDGIGPYITDKLIQHVKNQPNPNIVPINTGPVPENFTSIIKKHNPNKIIMIDATEMSLTPGAIRIIKKEQIEELALTTHSMPLSILISYLETITKNITLIGIQPRTIEDSENLSDILSNKSKIIIEYIINNKIDNIKILEN